MSPDLSSTLDRLGDEIAELAAHLDAATARVELADQIEQARGGGVEVPGQLGDLVAQPIERAGKVG